MRRPRIAVTASRSRSACPPVATASAQCQLLAVASQFPDFPIVLEAVRECLQDVYDLPALIDLLRSVATRRVRVVETETESPSPFAASLLFGYVGAFMYDDDAPIAERRAAALSLDTALLAQLLGRVDLRELLDPAVITEVTNRLQRFEPSRQARDAQDVVDLLRWLGPLTTEEVDARYRGDDPDAVSAGAQPSMRQRFSLLCIATGRSSR